MKNERNSTEPKQLCIMAFLPLSDIRSPPPSSSHRWAVMFSYVTRVALWPLVDYTQEKYCAIYA